MGGTGGTTGLSVEATVSQVFGLDPASDLLGIWRDCDILMSPSCGQHGDDGCLSIHLTSAYLPVLASLKVPLLSLSRFRHILGVTFCNKNPVAGTDVLLRSPPGPPVTSRGSLDGCLGTAWQSAGASLPLPQQGPCLHVSAPSLASWSSTEPKASDTLGALSLSLILGSPAYLIHSSPVTHCSHGDGHTSPDHHT